MSTTIAIPTPGVGMPQCLRADEPDRDARAFLSCLNPWIRPAARYTVRGLRRRWRLLALALGQGKPVAAVTQQVIDGPAGPIALKVVDPRHDAALRPALVWCHGGGFTIGSPDCTDAMCRSMAHGSGCIVVSVTYRLAPEHDLYAGREDVHAALRWVAQHGERLGIDTARLAIGGDSAGGNLAAAVAQRCVAQGGPALGLQLLVYPATNLKSDYPSKAENAYGYLLTAESMVWLKSLITGSADLGDPWISPGCNTKLQGLPPALIVTAGFDPVRDDGLDYAARLRAAGVQVELLHYAGQFHGFLNFDSLIGAGRDALERIGGSLHRTLCTGQPIDRTLEIADAPSRGMPGIFETVGEVASVALVVCGSLGLWSVALMRAVSPAALNPARILLNPVVNSGTWAWRRIGDQLDRLAARQTHPARDT